MCNVRRYVLKRSSVIFHNHFTTDPDDSDLAILLPVNHKTYQEIIVPYIFCAFLFLSSPRYSRDSILSNNPVQ